jgi:ABC-type antimicrobial peptide transport system permease subunit
MTVIGVVGDVRQSSPAAQPGPELYMPLWQHPFVANDAELVLRTLGNPALLIPAVQNTVRDVNPEIAVKFTTMSELVSDSIGAQRFRTVLASIFAVLALVLALSGMYALMSYVTTQRTAEFGLRSALGARPRNIIYLVLGGATKLAVIGVITGTLFSILTGRVLSSMLFGVKSADALTYALVIAIVVPVVLSAAALPAWRASRIDPMVALRYE